MVITLVLIFILLLLHYTIFLVKIFIGLNNLKKPPFQKLPDEFVSVIIPFRNESGNILKSLASIEGLNYPDEKFEVIYVDDNSTDDSFNLLCENRRKNNIRILKLPGEVFSKGNKKRAVHYGIENSAGEIVVATDADCIHKKNWLNSLLGSFDSGTAFISAPVDFKDGSSVFVRMQKLEFQGLILAGAGLIGYGKPVICNGANLAYRKKIFFDVGGFEDNINLSSGDDELLMQKIARLKIYKIKFCPDKDSVVTTNSNENIRDFFNQRKRWASKGLFYRDKFLIVKLFLIFLFYSGLIIQPVLALIGYTVLRYTFIISILFKIFIEFLIIRKGESMFCAVNNRFIFLITEIFQVPYIIISSFNGLFGNFTWKNREIKR